MALDDLKETIETLRERIQAHHAYLKRKETRTRQVLIDPMLRVLGWDVEDPDFVQLEYIIHPNRLDYALMGSRPVAVIEAKTLGTSLDDALKMQALNYANRLGILYMIITDGDHWQMFDVFKPAPLEDRVLMDFQLTRDELSACASSALRMAREEPLMIKALSCTESSTNQPVPAPLELSSGQEVADSSNNGDWEPLTTLSVDYGHKTPAYIKFPDSTTKPIWSWVKVWDAVAEYLIETGRISAEDCPVRKGNSRRYILHTEPVHLNGKKFRRPRAINGLWLARSFISGQRAVKTSCWLLENFGIDPSTVLVSANRS